MADQERKHRAQPPLSVIGSTVVMKGELLVDEALIIEGTYAGTINASDTVTVRRSAQLSGEVAATHLRVQQGTSLENAALTGRIKLTAD